MSLPSLFPSLALGVLLLGLAGCESYHDPLSEPEFESLSREEKIEQLMPLYQNSRSRAEEELMMWEHRQR